MVARSYRLFKKSDFDRLFARGLRYRTPLLSLVVSRGTNPLLRFAVIISVKTAKRASERNLLRRRLTEYVRHLLPQLHKGYDCAFIVHPKAVTARREDFTTAASFLLKKARLLF